MAVTWQEAGERAHVRVQATPAGSGVLGIRAALAETDSDPDEAMEALDGIVASLVGRLATAEERQEAAVGVLVAMLSGYEVGRGVGGVSDA